MAAFITGSRPRALRTAVTAPGNSLVTSRYAASPGQVVIETSRCPAIVLTRTSVPAGHLFEPRDRKVAVAPGEVSMAYRSASQASRVTAACRAAGVGGVDV